MPRKYRIDNYAPEYMEIFKLVLERGFHHIEYPSDYVCQSAKWRWYRFFRAVEQNCPELKDDVRWMTVNWKKGVKYLELRDKRKGEDVLAMRASRSEPNLVVHGFGSEADIWDVPEPSREEIEAIRTQQTEKE